MGKRSICLDRFRLASEMSGQKRCQMVVRSAGGGPKMLCRIIWAAMSVRRRMEGLDRVASRSREGEDSRIRVLQSSIIRIARILRRANSAPGHAVRRQGVEIEQRFPAFEQKFNGLITNDKFCLSRTGRLALSWWRYPLRLRDPAPEGADTVPDLEDDRGGGHETPLAGSPPDAAGFGRRSAVGSGLHAHSELGSGRQGVGARGGKRHLPTSSGGEP